MRSWMICYVAGIICALTLTQFIPLSGCIFIALLVVVLGIKLRAFYFSAGLVGLLWGAFWINGQLQAQLPESLNRTDWLLTGVISGLLEQTGSGLRFNLRVESATQLSGSASFTPQTVRLSWYEPERSLSAGMRVSLRARLKRPHGQYNPQGFDYEKWLIERGIGATGYVLSLESVATTRLNSFTGLRHEVNQQLAARYPAEWVGLLQALTTGTRSALSDDQWLMLQHSGTLHLAVISGMHIGLLALVGWWLGRVIGLMPQLQGQRWPPYCMAIVTAAFYLYLSGFGIPAQRAFLMLAVLLGAGWRLQQVEHWTRWWLALAVVLTLSPIAIYNAGFWLSFIVVAVLIILYQSSRSGCQLWQIQLLLLPALMPLTVMFFSGVSWVSPLANLLAIPWISILVPVLLLDQLLYLLGIELLQPVVELMAQAFWFALEWLEQWPVIYQSVPSPDLSVLLLAMLGAVLLILPAGMRFKWLALVMLLPLLFSKPTVKPQGAFDVWVFDVGQGLAVWINTANNNLLYDLGPGFRSGSSAFEWSVLPAIRARGIQSIDTLVLSHNDTDHTGGYAALKNSLEVQQSYASYPLVEKESQHCRAGMQWQQDGVFFRFLSGSTGVKDNQRSCVLYVTNGACSLLLTGDIDQTTELGLPVFEKPLTWLLSSHHGSRYSNGPDVIRRWRPETVIHSAGFGNPYNHPHPDVVRRYAEIGSIQWSTAVDGAIHLTAKDGKCLSQSFNNQQPRFWR
ncbi:DNA internalization-related competence protein ComEC/Rec2 [Neptuniibacter sp. CAU 1671]|uniref:DNA internalization-related competence protein ComEC/Rec2 n=1 Tax=Neptuniibacter sp. CAU 1671 TaxID=3032593 RepID=UPI0023DB4C0A|nr:DNA internalization-related competence protein ComEC/Rec2 [Neptuniibacter sp. CAU 1671]MDF2180808.1 DNA internalization-related competence protein ComEC/Rec2 [Neptuniibacter sp. CAU 1671]